MPRVMALTALTALGLSGEPVHEPVHARSFPASRLLLLCVTALAAPGLRRASGLDGHGVGGLSGRCRSQSGVQCCGGSDGRTAESADRGIVRPPDPGGHGGQGCRMLMPGLPARSVIDFAIWALQVIATDRYGRSVIN
jgi:hypothetical protein